MAKRVRLACVVVAAGVVTLTGNFPGTIGALGPLVYAQPGSGVRENQWTDLAGNPIAGAKITITRTLGPAIELTTDEQGMSAYPANKNDWVEMTVSHPLFQAVYTEWFPSMFDRKEALPVVIKETPGTYVFGRVVDAQGQGVPGAKVRLYGWAGGSGGVSGGTPRPWVLANGNGEFKVGLPKDVHGLPVGSRVEGKLRVLARGRVVAQDAVARPGFEARIVLEDAPKRDIVLQGPDGAKGPAWDPAKGARVIYAVNKVELEFKGPLDRLLNVPLPAGIYMVSYQGIEYGPTVLAKDAKGGPLILRAPAKQEVLVTVVDPMTGKPLAGATVVTSTGKLSDTQVMSYVTPDLWDRVLNVARVEDAAEFPERLKAWYAQARPGFSQIKTDGAGQARVQVTPSKNNEVTSVVVLGPGIFPWVQELSPGAKEATVYGVPSATLTVLPGKGKRERLSEIQGSIQLLTRIGPGFKVGPTVGPGGTLIPARISNEPQVWKFSGIEADAENKILVPAGVDLKLSLRTLDGEYSYSSQVIRPAARQTVFLGKPVLGPANSVLVALTDKTGAKIAEMPVYMSQEDGKWSLIGRTNQEGAFSLTHGKPDGVTLGVLGYGQTPQEVPAHQAKVAMEAYFKRGKATFDMDLGELEARQAAAKMATVQFCDAQGLSMPGGTKLIKPADKSGGAQELTLDDQGRVSGPALAKLYGPGVLVSHPDYGTAMMQGGKVNFEKGLVLPLLAKGAADTWFVVTGKVVGPTGAPLKGMRVAIWSSLQMRTYNGALDMASKAPIVALTGDDGTFRACAITVGSSGVEMMHAREPNATLGVGVVGPDQWTLGYGGVAIRGEEMVIKPVVALREFQLEATTPQGQPENLTRLSAYYKNESTGQQLYLQEGWMPESGKRPLAYGTYRMSGGSGSWEPLTVDEKSPEKLVLTRLEMPGIVGRVVDANTGEGLENVLVLRSDHSVGYGGPDLWKVPDSVVAEAAKTPVTYGMGTPSPKELYNVAAPKAAMRTGRDGAYRFEGSARTSANTVLALAPGYMPGGVNADRIGTKEEKDLRPGDIKLIPGARVNLEPPVLEKDLIRVANKPELTGTVIYQLPEEWIRETKKGDAPVRKMMLPRLVNPGPISCVLPAGVPVRVFIDTSPSEQRMIVKGREYVIWEMEAAQTFKQGVAATVKLNRVPLIPVEVRFIMSDGRTLTGRGIRWVVAQEPEVLSRWPQRPRDKTAILMLPAGRKVQLELEGLEEDRFELKVPGLDEQAPAGLQEVKTFILTPDQMVRANLKASD